MIVTSKVAVAATWERYEAWNGSSRADEILETGIEIYLNAIRDMMPTS